jgi:hypothetical protein
MVFATDTAKLSDEAPVMRRYLDQADSRKRHFGLDKSAS